VRKLYDGVNVSALKIHMSESAHDALAVFPEFITELRGEIPVKVGNNSSQTSRLFWRKLFTNWCSASSPPVPRVAPPVARNAVSFQHLTVHGGPKTDTLFVRINIMCFNFIKY